MKPMYLHLFQVRESKDSATQLLLGWVTNYNHNKATYGFSVEMENRSKENICSFNKTSRSSCVALRRFHLPAIAIPGDENTLSIGVLETVWIGGCSPKVPQIDTVVFIYSFPVLVRCLFEGSVYSRVAFVPSDKVSDASATITAGSQPFVPRLKRFVYTVWRQRRIS